MIVVNERPCAQGELLVMRVASIPANAEPMKAEGEHYVVGHSESGHHHVIDRPRAAVFEAADDKFTLWVRSLGDGAELRHLRSFDTHESLYLPPGDYMIRRQREYVSEGFRAASD